MQPASEEEIRRAAKAIADAPRTESGLILPPHVLAEKEAAREHEERPMPNRAERRWQEKQARRQARRRARISPKAREALEQIEEMTEGMNEHELTMAAAMVRDAAATGQVDDLGALQ